MNFKDKKFLFLILKRILFIVVSTTLFFNIITIKTASLQGYVDGCDRYGYPFTYSQSCETVHSFSNLNYMFDIGFVLLISIVVLVCLEFLFNFKKALKNKISFVLLIVAVLYFALFYLYFRINPDNNFIEKIYLTSFLIGVAYILRPIKKRTVLLIFSGMIFYSFIIFYWSINYSYKKNFDFKGETLTYNYSPFNATFDKLFKKEKGYLNYQSTNEFKKKRAIDFFLFLQCEIYKTKQNYTSKMKESIKNGSLKIIYNREYSKDNLKEFIVETIKEDELYNNRYRNYTKQSTLQFDTIVNHRYEIFNISSE